MNKPYHVTSIFVKNVPLLNEPLETKEEFNIQFVNLFKNWAKKNGFSDQIVDAEGVYYSRTNDESYKVIENRLKVRQIDDSRTGFVKFEKAFIHLALLREDQLYFRDRLLKFRISKVNNEKLPSCTRHHIYSSINNKTKLIISNVVADAIDFKCQDELKFAYLLTDEHIDKVGNLITNPTVGMACAIKLINGFWTRARIINILSPIDIEVTLIDYSKPKYILTLMDVRNLPYQLLYPPSFKIKLFGLEIKSIIKFKQFFCDNQNKIFFVRFEYMDTIVCKGFKDLFEYAYVVNESGILLNQYLCKTGIAEYKTEQHSALVREFLFKHNNEI